MDNAILIYINYRAAVLRNELENLNAARRDKRIARSKFLLSKLKINARISELSKLKNRLREELQ